MRIGCLQFAPQVGDVDNNLTLADEILSKADPEGLDLLVLPELAFSGYNFKSLQQISPYLEPSASGISSLWSRSMALKYDCTVVTGYPERVDTSHNWPADPEYYNSALVISDEGETVANYRKANLYYTDVTWALEGPDGFYRGRLPNLGQTAIGICMDLNPYKFEAPWDKFEFAHHVLDSGARLVIVSMAWLTHDEPTMYNLQPQEPDTSTLMYWISRFEPVIQARLEEEIIIIFANRSGMESEVVYAGTSTVVGIKNGEVSIYGILGRCDNELLVVDTDAPPFAKLVHQTSEQTGAAESCNTPSSEESDTTDASNFGRTGGSLDGTSRASPSEESRHNGSSTNHSYKKSSSFSRRDDLSINVSGRPKGPTAPLESPFIHTPTAPSPTPYQIRPQLFMPNDDSRLQQFIDYNSSPNPQEAQPSQAVSTESKADERDLIAMLDSQWHEPSNRNSVSSTCSSLQYWMPSARPNGLGLTTDHSVATRDNLEKHEKERTAHRTPRVDVLGVTSSPRIGPPSTKRSQRRTEALNGQRSLSQEPSAKDHRSGSQSRVLRRSNSATAITSTVGRQLKKAPTGSDTDRGNSVRLKERSKTYELDDRKVVSQQQLSHPSTRASRGHQRSLSRSGAVQSVPVQSGNPKNRGGSVGRHSAQASHRVTTPILQPATISRLMDQSVYNQVQERTPSKSRVDPLDRVPSMSTTVDDARPASRGRQRETKPIQSQGDQTGRKRSQNSRVNNTPQTDPIDLSQFRLIEEYPSANCPVHGRSRSGTGSRQRNTPDSRSRTKNQVPRQQANPSYNGVADGSPPMRRRPSKSGVSQTPDTYNYSLRSSKPVTDSPRPGMIIRAATIGPGQEMATESSRPRDKDSVVTEIEPKTPVAMVLVFDQEEKPIPPLKCVDRSILDEPIMRPRSAVW